MDAVEVNGRRYRLPAGPVVVICVDGCAPEYLEAGLAGGLLPALARFRERGFFATADCVIPSFTNPNNLSIVTGAPPAVHGIAGNYFLEPETGREVMMNEPRFLMAETILAAFARQGASVAIVTAKDKLRRLLGHGAAGAVCFSAEKAHEANQAEHGISGVREMVGRETPGVYSAALSEFVMEAGIGLLEARQPGSSPPRLMYLSTTDYIQHKYAPGRPEANDFYRSLDRAWGRLEELGAVVAITADHGMNAKSNARGDPNVIYLAPLLEQWLGPGRARVVLPITDPYVAHHGALGSFATVYLESAEALPSVLSRLAELPGIVLAATREEACRRFELPPERVGDIVIVSDNRTVLGKSPAEHDLTQLTEPLRSHGGLAEQRVPFIISAPLTPAYRQKAEQGLRNFDILDFAINGVEIARA